MRTSKFETVATVESSKDPCKVWKVARHRDTGLLSCNCPSYRFKGDTQKLPDGQVVRTCKHIRAYEAELEQDGIAGTQLAGQVIKPAPWVQPLQDALGSLGTRQARQVARQRPHRTPGGQYDGPLVPLVLRAAKAAGILDELTEWRWREFAEKLAPFVAGGLPAEPAQAAFDLRPVRRIILED